MQPSLSGQSHTITIILSVRVVGATAGVLQLTESTRVTTAGTSTTITAPTNSTVTTVMSSISTTFESSSSSISSSPAVVDVILPSGVGTNTSLNFTPWTIRVMIGVNNTIIWTDHDSTPHTVTSVSVPSGEKQFDSGTLREGATFSTSLTVAGTYEYHCQYHPGWMKDTIVVISR
jgi:plastocyanin